MSALPQNDSIDIRDVWNYNLEDEFNLIRDVVGGYRYIAMDTEFPGAVIRLTTDFKFTSELNYKTHKINVNLMNLIQLGLTLSDEKGNLPTCGTDKQCLWQFNFREFDPDVDIGSQASVDLLKMSGINFAKNKEMGVDARKFSELLMSSGVVMNNDVVLVTFHGGYDCGYLVKMLSGRDLPDSQEEFFKLIKVYFPVLYDIKHLMKYCNSLFGGLNELAERLQLKRVGTCHQAGSDSLLTSRAYIKLKENFFSGSPRKYAGVLYRLGDEY